MNDGKLNYKPPLPKHSLLFKIVGLLAKCQLRYLARNVNNIKPIMIGFVAVGGIVAIGTIATAAYLTDFPLLFPPLGPSAFILFFIPMGAAASPRSCIMAHYIAALSGVVSLHLFMFIFPDANFLAGADTSWLRIGAICLAMGLICASMIGFNCVHPPAAATALMGAMGYLNSIPHVIGLLSAVLVLVIEAFIFNRLLGGLPYPSWAPDPKVLKDYGSLAGLPGAKSTVWAQFADKVFERRAGK